jgi:hypothetical protein
MFNMLVQQTLAVVGDGDPKPQSPLFGDDAADILRAFYEEHDSSKVIQICVKIQTKYAQPYIA